MRKEEEEEIFSKIKQQIESAPRKEKMLTIHRLMFLNSKFFTHLTAKDFCDRVGLPASFRTEFSKIRNLSESLDGTFILDGDGLPMQVFSLVSGEDIIIPKGEILDIFKVTKNSKITLNVEKEQFLRLIHNNAESVNYIVSMNDSWFVPREPLLANKAITIKIPCGHTIYISGHGVLNVTLMKA